MAPKKKKKKTWNALIHISAHKYISQSANFSFQCTGSFQLLVPKALVDLTNDIVPLRLFNPTDQPQTVCRDTIASLCEPVEDVSVASRKGVDRSGNPAGRACRVTPSSTPLPAYLDDLHQRSTSCLEEAQKAEVAALLAEFAHAFASSADDGSTSIVKHEIQTNKS